jgi:hypothetical protein
MAQLEVQPGSNITVTVNKGPLSGGLPAGTIGDIQYNVDGQRFGNVAPLHYDAANAQVVMGSVGSIALAGGIQGQVITNLGDGVMAWSALDGITSGTTAVTATPTSVNISVGNEPNIANITEQAMTFRGNILPESDITYDLGSPTQRWRDLYLSSSTIDMGGVRLSSDGQSIVSSGGMVVQGALVSREFYGNISGDYLRGDGSEIYNVNGANVIGSVSVSISSGIANGVSDAQQPNITSVGTLTELTVEGPVDLGGVANITITGGSNGQFLSTNGSGDVQFATVALSNISNATTRVETRQHSANITVSGGAVAEFGNSIITLRRNTNLAGNLALSGNVSANVVEATTIKTGGLSANGAVNLGDVTNLTIVGGNSGQALTTNGLGGLGWRDLVQLKNGSSNVVIVENNWIRMGVAGSPDALIVKETGLKVIPEGDSNLGNIVRANYFYGNTIAATNFNLGNVDDVTLLGGTSNAVLRTDGAGNLSFHFIDETLIRDNGNANSNVRATSSGVKISANGVPNVISVYKDGSEGRVDIVGNTHVGGTLYMNTGNVNGELDVLGDATIGGNLTVTGNITYVESNTVNIGDKNITLAANATTAVQADGGGITLAGADANIEWRNSSNSWTFSHPITGNLLGVAQTAAGLNANIANVSISSGSSGQVLSTNGNGVLSWATISAVSGGNTISGNTSSVSIFPDGNVGIQIDGVANIAKFSDIGLEVTGITTDELVVTGNVDVIGNIVAANVDSNYFNGVHIGGQQARITNNSGTQLTLGKVVYISGSQGDRIAANLAIANSEPYSTATIGFVTETINNNATGLIQFNGTLVVGNTSSHAAGAQVYLSPTVAGGWTTTKPQAPQHTVILGWIERVHNTQGSIYISVTNGFELDELHNVLLPANVANISNRAILSFDSANSLWIDGTLDMGTY